jgi:hypothetical protein
METHEYHCISQLNAGTAGTLEVLGTELYKLAVSTAAGGPLLPSVRRESGQSIPSVTVTPVAALPVVAFMARRTFADAGVPAAIEGKADVEEAGSERALFMSTRPRTRDTR